LSNKTREVLNLIHEIDHVNDASDPDEGVEDMNKVETLRGFNARSNLIASRWINATSCL